MRLAVSLSGLLLVSTAAWADGGVSFQDIAADDGLAAIENGLVYSRAPSASEAIWDTFRQAGVFSFFETSLTPLKSRGAPGVVLFDYDADGDLDIYVTNGPGAENSLFSNQLAETGVLGFLDFASAAGVNAPDQDSTGACFGDIDNDGDKDLLVLSSYDPNRLFENNGDGTFTDISWTSGLVVAGKTSVSCSFGDIDHDGLLDVVVANCCVDMSNQLATGTPEPFAFNQHNQLFRNTGGNAFVDVSASSGILDQRGFPPGFEGSPGVTWAVAMVDYDQDGDVDIFTAEDQAAVPLARDGGVDRGLIHLYENDGGGHFVDRTVEAGLNRGGAWMGLSFGDLNGDGALDVFGTNLGDWAVTLLTPLDPAYTDLFNYVLGDMSSRWYLGSAEGVFTDPGLGSIVATPFGWGTSIADYDNDADVDIIYHGGLLPGAVVQTAPGVILRNDGAAGFTRDVQALASSTNHELRTVQGVATGDLDGNGFVDIVSVSNFDIPDGSLATYNHHWGSPFDGGRYSQFFMPTEIPFLTAYSGVEYPNGTLSVELNGGENRNRWAKVELLGSVGFTAGGSVNRDGIGAVVTFETARGAGTSRPVLGGSSYASQDSLEMVFGLGGERRGRIDVLWPGGVRNRLYGVRAGEKIVFPEIPCGFDAEWKSFGRYVSCVHRALRDLRRERVISRSQKARFFSSALIAFIDENY